MANDVEEPSFGARTFVQTAVAPLPQLDRWEQVTEDEVSMVADMTRRNELSGGTPVVRAFEQRWREWVGSKFCITTVNGTSALYSAYFGLGVGPGDEVICPVKHVDLHDRARVASWRKASILRNRPGDSDARCGGPRGAHHGAHGVHLRRSPLGPHLRHGHDSGRRGEARHSRD